MRAVRFVLFTLLSASLTTPLMAAPPAAKRIYIAPDDHTDYLWSADEETYRKVFIEMIDYYLDLAAQTAGNPPGQQSRWNCDGSLWLWTYEKNKTPEEFARLIRRIRDGHISVPLNALVSTYGAQPAEAVLRGMYYAGSVERRFGIELPIAIAMEDQTLPYGLGALWAGAGARYSWKGICGCATRMRRHERRQHEVYWWKGQDGSRILMKWYSLLAKNTSVGGYAEAFDPASAVELVDSDPRFTSIHPYSVIGLFGKGWDRLKTLTDEFVTVARTQTNPSRQVIVSNQLDYFRDLEASYGDRLPEQSAAFGNEWDLYSASLAEVSARVRRSVERLRTAEALASLVAPHRPGFLDRRKASRDRAWMDLGLYWEHNWTADGPVIKRSARAAWQRRLAGEIESYIDDLYRDSAYALGDLIENPGPYPRFYVFNPLGHKRTGPADYPWDGEGGAHVIDVSTGKEVPSQILNHPDATLRKGRNFLRIIAGDVPPVGYKVFEIRPGNGGDWPATLQATAETLENEYYRLRIAARGAITSWIDKNNGNRELVRLIAGRAVNDLGPGDGVLTVADAGPVSATIQAVSPSPLRHTTRITMYRGSPRIDIENEITENFAGVRDWAFSFNIEEPRVWHEEVGAVIQARRQRDGGDYSDTNARLDWLTMNHFADIHGPDSRGVTISNADCSFMKLGRSETQDRTSWLDINTPQISVLIGGQVDGPRLGIPAQGGDEYFRQRFALRTHGAFHPAPAMRFALEHQNPLLAGEIRGGSAYPAKSYSLLQIDNPDVLLWALKPPEEGIAEGLIARVWNLAPENRRITLRLESGIAEAGQATHIETGVKPVPIHGGVLEQSLRPSQMVTLWLRPAIPATR